MRILLLGNSYTAALHLLEKLAEAYRQKLLPIPVVGQDWLNN